jgi:hypothetical protein
MSQTLCKYNRIVVKVAFLPGAECIRLMLNLIRLIFEQNYARQESNLLLRPRRLSSKWCGVNTVAQVNKQSNSETDKSQLSGQDVRLLLVMCTELVNLCAKLTGKIDPAAAAMLAYVRDDIASENKLELQ